MQRIKRKRSKQPLVIAVAIILAVILIGGIAYLYYRDDSQPAENPTSDSTVTEQDNQDDSSDSTVSDGDDSTQDAADNPSNSEPTNGSSDDKPYVSSPSRTPAVDEPYPVETEHYRIDRVSSTSYRVTLYPLVHASDPDGYDAELRDYKASALDYLEKRHGSVQNLTITWVPDRANNI